MALHDQFEHGRIPIRPLQYAKKDLALTDELIIDYGKTGNESWHIYLTDSNDSSVLIDLTQLMIDQMLPKAKINADEFDISIDGEEDRMSLKEIISFIYKRFIYPANYGLFNYDEYKDELFDDSTINTLLRDLEGRVVLPVTLADNVFFSNGKTLEDNYKETPQLVVSKTSTIVDDTNTIVFDYPFNKYNGFIEVRINGEYIQSENYNIEENVIDNDGNFYTGTITLNESLEDINNIVDILFIYNTYTEETQKNIDGKLLNIHSIPSTRLEKKSDSYLLQDSGSLATSTAVYNLYKDILELNSQQAENIVWCTDISEYDNFIHIQSDKNIVEYDAFICNVFIGKAKKYNATALIKYNETDAETNIFIYDTYGRILSKGLPAGKIARFLWIKSENCLRLINTDIDALRKTKYIYKCLDNETKISYSLMDYIIGADISVYKNGLRLFEDIDYSINTKEENITLYNPTRNDDMIVFEAISM